MLSYRRHRSLPVLILLAGLTLTPASAFSLRSAVTHHSPRDFGSSVWAWLSHLVQAAWEKNGMTIDPNGQPTATTPPGPNG
ncbi:MAG TPA: hypothetical protein VGQ28_09575 [Thermoanaerobaculia bacterium]|jgi:hypothetical protein|nr:hypothetical protein [Thermoanaerobaculia bacterium]